MTSSRAAIDCSVLSDMTGFQEYISLVRNATGFNTTLLGFCRSEICGALWGVGNPDVSGIGVSTAYAIDITLGFTLAASCYVLRRDIGRQPWAWLKARTRRPIERGFDSFFTSSLYFAVSILIASNYSLAKKDFDVSANGFGIFEMQITFAVTVTSVLPLLYPLSMDPQADDAIESSGAAKIKSEYNSSLHKKFRLLLIGLVLVLFMYPFISQCIHNWAPTDIGEGSGPGGTTVVNSTEWSSLTTTCFEGVAPISNFENTVISAFELVGSLLFILVTIWGFVGFFVGSYAMETSQDTAARRILVSTSRMLEKARLPHKIRLAVHTTFLLAPLLLCVPLLWGVFRLREAQKALALVTANLYLDNDWAFGQVVAIVLFAPVLIDVIQCSFELA